MEINKNIIELPNFLDFKRSDRYYDFLINDYDCGDYELIDYIRYRYDDKNCEILFNYCINKQYSNEYNKLSIWKVKIKRKENNFILKLPNKITINKKICTLDLISNNQYAWPLKMMHVEEFENGLKKLSGIIYKNKLLYRINSKWSIKKYEYI